MVDPGPVVLPVFRGALLDAPTGGYRLTVKLMDEVKGRAIGGALHSLSGAELSGLQQLVRTEGLSFRPLIDLSEDKVDRLLRRAEQRSGRAQPDLLGMLEVVVPSTDGLGLVRIGEALRVLPQVEWAYIEPLGCAPPTDIAPPTPDLESFQSQLGPDPGLDIVGAWALGLDGMGVQLSDCEYAWDYDHEEFNSTNLNPEPGQTPSASAMVFMDHGTASVGVAAAPVNGYGVTGIASGVTVYTFPELTDEGGSRRVASIVSANASSSPGDIILLEMQTTGPTGYYGPAEMNPAVFTASRTAVDGGVVVVAAAGNGSQDLDSSTYDSYMAMGDSGVILVGASSPDTNHDATNFTTYGSRVDVNAWGYSVHTAGYGDWYEFGGDIHQRYTSGFSGTSSASASIAGVCALVQERSIQLNGEGLHPLLLRQLLKDTGLPQGAGGAIGTYPVTSAAVANVPPYTSTPWIDLGQGLAGSQGVPTLTGDGALIGGTGYIVTLTNAQILSTSWLVVGFTDLSAPFKGGTMVPNPDMILPAGTGLGTVIFNGEWPIGVPPGIPFYLQAWVADSAGPLGYSASNALQAFTQ